MQLFICYFFFIFAVFRAENSSTSSPISIVPDWVLLSGCGPCRYCLALQGYEEPFFCITEVTEIPCYIRAQYYPEWTDGCSFANAQGGVALPVDDGIVIATIEDPIPECEPRIEPCRCHEHVYFLVWAIFCFVVITFVFVIILIVKR